jgi:hypothetical protein
MECLREQVHIARRLLRKYVNITPGGCSPILPPPFEPVPRAIQRATSGVRTVEDSPSVAGIIQASKLFVLFSF